MGKTHANCKLVASLARGGRERKEIGREVISVLLSFISYKETRSK